MVRTTFTAMPRRGSVLAAKIVLVTTVAVAVGLVSNLLSFALGQRILAPTGMSASLLDPGAARAVVLGAVGVGLFAVVAISLGAVLRRSTTANILLALLVVGGQLIGAALPEGARAYLPSAALQALVTTNRTGDTLQPTAALAVLASVAAALAALAVHTTLRRDP